MISGTNGLLGAADGAFVLQKEKRTGNTAVLEVSGRDQPEQRLILKKDMERFVWELEKSETELWQIPPDPILEKVAALLSEEIPEWSGTPTELAEEALAAIMLGHGIEWEEKGEHKEHLSVLEFKREKRKEELAELEQTLERVQQKQISVQVVEQIEAKPLSLTSKMAIERDDYQALVTAAQKYVVQEKQEENMKKLLKEAKKPLPI